MLEARNRQGKFAEDYVRVLASAAGLLVYKDDLDHDGIDLGLRFPGRLGAVSSPAIEVQVKSCTDPGHSGGALTFRGLNEVQYNKLVDGPFTVPRYLFVVVVPADPRAYVRFETRGMVLGQLAYFTGFEGEKPFPKPDAGRRCQVRVPLGNVLTAETLMGLVRAVGDPAAAAE